MKKISTTISLLIISGVMNFAAAQSNVKVTATPADAQAQAKDYIIINGERVYTKADVMPLFPGGDKALFTFLQSNISYPIEARKNKIEGKVSISFTIGRDGAVKNVTLVRGIGSGCDEEAMRVISAMPKWTPGQYQGRPASIQYNLPVHFSLGGEMQK